MLEERNESQVERQVENERQPRQHGQLALFVETYQGNAEYRVDVEEQEANRQPLQGRNSVRELRLAVDEPDDRLGEHKEAHADRQAHDEDRVEPFAQSAAQGGARLGGKL